MIGKVRDKLQTYVTGPEAKLAQDWGHVGSKIPLPYFRRWHQRS